MQDVVVAEVDAAGIAAGPAAGRFVKGEEQHL